MIFLLSLALAAEPLAPRGSLDLDALTDAVLAANPEAAGAQATLDQARARAAAAGPWPDPMVDLKFAPLSLGGMAGWQAEVSQGLPLWGERRAARDMAGADADAAQASLSMVRLDLADMAVMAWVDWYTVHREITLMEASLVLLLQHREATLARYAVGRAYQFDALQAEAEAGSLRALVRSLELEREVTRARINTLLHRPTDTELPPPPATLALSAPDGSSTQRPEIAEAEAMIRAAEASVRMARIDRLPMLGGMAGWNGMEPMVEDRPMVGVRVSVPLDQRRRTAAVRLAQAGVARASAERDKVADAVALGIAEAEQRFRGQAAILATIEAEFLPPARARVEAARAAFAAGMDDVRPLLDAERGVLDAELRHEQALATLALRARELDLAHGRLRDGATP